MEISSQAQEHVSMTAPSENPSQEAMSSRRSFLGPKWMVLFATWNIHTMFETGKTAQVKTVETELSEMGLSWGEAQAIAKDKTRWKRDIVAALSPTGGNKD